MSEQQQQYESLLLGVGEYTAEICYEEGKRENPLVRGNTIPLEERIILLQQEILEIADRDRVGQDHLFLCIGRGTAIMVFLLTLFEFLLHVRFTP